MFPSSITSDCIPSSTANTLINQYLPVLSAVIACCSADGMEFKQIKKIFNPLWNRNLPILKDCPCKNTELMAAAYTAIALCSVFIEAVPDKMLGSADRAMTDWKRVQKLNFRSSDRRMLCIIPFMHGIWNQLLGFRNIRVFIPWKRTQGMTPRILIIMIHLLAAWSFQEPNDETAKSASIGSWKPPDVPFSDIGIIVYFQRTDGNLPPWCKWRFFLIPFCTVLVKNL